MRLRSQAGCRKAHLKLWQSTSDRLVRHRVRPGSATTLASRGATRCAGTGFMCRAPRRAPLSRKGWWR
jgi:hypothetical protein